MSTIDLGRPAVGAVGGGMGEADGDGEGEPLLKGFLRTEEPLSVLFVMMELRHQGPKSAMLLSKLHGS